MATKKYNFTRTEIMAGLMVLVSVAVMVGFVVVVENLQAEPEHKTVYAHFSGTTGLSNNAVVRFGGVEVGRVAEVGFDPDNQAQILVEAHVDPDTPINASSVATIEQVGLTTEKHLEISTGTQEALLLADGDVIENVINPGYGFVNLPDVDGLVGGSEQLIADIRDFIGVEAAKKAEAAGEEELASIARLAADVRKFLGIKERLDKQAASGEDELTEVAQLTDELSKLLGVQVAIETEEAGGEEMASVARITGDVRDLLGVEEAKKKAGGAGPANVENVIADVDGMLEGYDEQIGTILDKVPPLQDSATRALDGVATTVSDNKEEIDGIIANLNEITGTVSEDLEALLASLEQTLVQVNDLTGETRDLVHYNRPAIEDLIGDLGNTIRSLNVLVDDLKSHPNSVLFGRPESGRK